MNSGVGWFDSPKYSARTPSIPIATSASSRIRECGTAWTEAAMVGITSSILAIRSGDRREGYVAEAQSEHGDVPRIRREVHGPAGSRHTGKSRKAPQSGCELSIRDQR